MKISISKDVRHNLLAHQINNQQQNIPRVNPHLNKHNSHTKSLIQFTIKNYTICPLKKNKNKQSLI